MLKMIDFCMQESNWNQLNYDWVTFKFIIRFQDHKQFTGKGPGLLDYTDHEWR